MSRNWDETFKQWAKSLKETDEAKGSRASEEIRRAISSDPVLKTKNIDVYVTGSYRNNTNTRADSDVDIAVVLRDVVFYDLPEDGSVTREILGFKDSDYTFEQYREDMGRALRAAFGAEAISAGNKAYDVHATSYRLDADVAMLLQHRRYTGKRTASGEWEWLRGAELRPRVEPGKRIINWHEQHAEQGIKKNDATRRRFKRLVRILKRLRADMQVQGDPAAKSAAGQARSFLIECLVFNAPNGSFDQADGGYIEDVRKVLRWLIDATKPGADTSRFVEVSGLKALFSPSQPWSKEQAHAFLLGAWAYLAMDMRW